MAEGISGRLVMVDVEENRECFRGGDACSWSMIEFGSFFSLENGLRTSLPRRLPISSWSFLVSSVSWAGQKEQQEKHLALGALTLR